MLARLLPLLAIVVACVLGVYLYTQGTLQQFIRPSVIAVETKRPLIQGQKIRKGYITVKEVGINRVSAGMITFPAGTTPEDVEKALGGQTVARSIPKNDILRSYMLGEASEIVVLRARADITEGAPLSMENIEASSLDVAPPGGAIIFDTEEEAFLYINKAYDLAARKAIYSGQVLTVDDTSGVAEKIFVVRTTRDFSRNERLSINGLEPAEIDTKDIPPGAIAFQTRGATDIFITSAGKFVLSDTVETGEAVTAEMISAAAPEIATDPNALPQTLAELTAYMQAYPDRAMFLDESSYIGQQPQERDRVDIWAEDSRSDGEFGQINLVRIAEGVIVRGAVDTSAPEPAKAAGSSETEGGEETDEPKEKFYYWIAIDPDVKHRFEAARKSDGLSMAVNGRTKMMHLLGNGASCLGDFCQVNRKSSSDLGHIAKVLNVEEPGVLVNRLDEEDGQVHSPLLMIDGVSPELASRLQANGYGRLEAIAAWSDTEIPAVTIKLDISNNLAVYIRQQARNLTSSAEKAARELGFDVPPSE